MAGTLAASVTGSGEYADFSDAVSVWNDAADGATLKLLSDVTTDRTISVSGTKTLDLNGHGIRKTGSGSVINVGDASLTLKDSDPSVEHKYTIASPKSNGAGLAVVDDASGTQTFTGGYITGGNTNDRGGGVVVNGGSLTMNGGTVIGNNAALHGGGVALMASGDTFVMNDGALIGNTGKYGGGLSMILASSGTVNGGKIQYNCTSNNGGGIHTDGAGQRVSLTITGGAITNNYCDGGSPSGGGVLVAGATFNLSGSVEIKDNLRKSGADNLCLKQGNTVNVAATLSNSTPIGVTMDTPGVFTNTASDKVSYNDAVKFVSDDADYAVFKNSSGQLELRVPPVASVTNGDETGEYTTFADALTEWADGSTLTLLSDVTTNSTISVSGTKTLDLNGHGIRMTGSGSVIHVGSGANLTLNDSDPNGAHNTQTFTGGYITGGNTADKEGGGGVLINGGSLTMNGGTIKDNNAYDGGGVYVVSGATLHMTGGAIEGNRARNNGAGVAVESGATFQMSGGAIRYNACDKDTGGVLLRGEFADFTMSGGSIQYNTGTTIGGIGSWYAQPKFSGAPVVKDNVKGGTVSNTGTGYILKNGTPCNAYNVGSVIAIVGALQDGAEIGMTIPDDGVGVFTGSANTAFNDPTKFVSDNASYAVFQNTSGQLELRVPPVASVTSGGTTTEYTDFAEAVSHWTNGSTLTLLDDVTSGRIEVTESKTLDLNGKTITFSNDNAEARIICVLNQNTIFTLEDSSGDNSGKLTGINTTNDWSGAIYINSGAVVNMYGGTITGNHTAYGAGVWIDGRGHRGSATFNMYGGAITGNTATTGGGVYVGIQLNEYAGTAHFNMYGGTITGNTATTGSNVYVDHGVMTQTGGTIDGGFSHNDYVAVSFNANGGTGTMSNQYVKKATNTQIKANVNYGVGGAKTDPAFFCEGYTFAGWNTQADGNGTNYAVGTDSINADADTTLYAVWTLNTYTVTFDANGGKGTMAEQTVSHNVAAELVENAFVRADYTFAGWNTQADGMGTPYADGASVTLTAPLTLYAQWTSKPLYTVSGTVKQGDAAVSKVTLRLVQGEKKIAVTATNDDGEFSFSAPDGIYNIVAEKAGKTKTELVTLNANQQVVITMPSENVNSTLTVTGSEIKNVMVGGLDELAMTDSKPGKTVTVTMTVEEKEDAANKSNIQEIAAANQSLDCLEIKIEKTVDSGTAQDVTDTGSKVLEIVVPYRFTGKKDVEVYRYHGSVEKLKKEDSKADGTYQTDENNGLIYIYASKFSTYAIGYTQLYTVACPINYGSYTGTVTVSLLDASDNVAASHAIVVNNGSGTYSFTGVPEGEYKLRAVWTEGEKETTLNGTLRVQ